MPAAVAVRGRPGPVVGDEQRDGAALVADLDGRAPGARMLIAFVSASCTIR
jgi:hypothetical protein